ncbi:MAG TPA: M14 family metallopeptidase, partial [Candidatus Cloacimonadota bacterium]|nr:M14 family metallopeptidase [Candidatus Cloacimonadota bacterium]
MMPRPPAMLLTAVILLLGACAPNSVNIYPLGKSYPRFERLQQDIMEICKLNPELAKYRIIGFSGTEELPIYAMQIGQGERNILIIGQHHGDEVLGVGLSLHFARHLLSGYPQDKTLKSILEDNTFWIIPTINPEGLRIVSSGQLQFKRKNNRDTDHNKRLDLRTDGVDLNRNYPVFWDLDPDTNTLSPYYKGTAPASEPEVQAVIALAQRVDFTLGMFFHSSASGAYSEKVYLPATVEKSSKFLALENMADFYARQVPRDYYKGTYSLHGGATSRVGNARNFFFHRLGVPAMLIEIGGINRQGRSIIHPGDRLQQKIMRKHTKALEKLLTE